MRITINEETMTLALAKKARSWVKDNPFGELLIKGFIETMFPSTAVFLGLEKVEVGCHNNSLAYGAIADIMVDEGEKGVYFARVHQKFSGEFAVEIYTKQ